jgi:hypothetical protein
MNMTQRRIRLSGPTDFARNYKCHPPAIVRLSHGPLNDSPSSLDLGRNTALIPFRKFKTFENLLERSMPHAAAVRDVWEGSG